MEITKRKAKITFLLGTNIYRSLSPAFQNVAFQKTGFNSNYSLLDVGDSEFDSALTSMLKTRTVIGFNITAPYKERILSYLTDIDRIASEIGAVNTVKVQGNKLLGFNTDVEGIAASLKKLGFSRSNRGRRALVIGAGGAARACIYTLLNFGFEFITIMNRTDYHAKAVAKELGGRFQSSRIDVVQLDARHFADAVAECDLVINAISDSTAEYFPIRLDFSKAKKNLKLFDLGYRETSLMMKTAESRGIRTLGGLLMLVEQGARSFEIWTGIRAPRAAMIAAAKRALESGGIVRVTTHSAISVVNALPTGKGATIGIGIQCRVSALFKQSSKSGVEIKSGVKDPHGLVRTCVDYALDEMHARIPDNQVLQIEIDSDIPAAVGLKSSSAVSVAVVKAVFELFHASKDWKSILDVSCRASKDSGASITGAYDDASASLLGGVVCTDNTKFRIEKHYSQPKGLGTRVEILVPRQRKYTSSVDTAAYSRMKTDSLKAFHYAIKGEIAQAMFLNSLVQSVALEYSLDPVIVALMSGASASGITGKGPAVSAICTDAKTASNVRKTWSERFPDCEIVSSSVIQPTM